MTDDANIHVEGVSYVPSRQAAKDTGYTQDYIGQLARKGLIDAKRIGGLWYISMNSLAAYKQTADQYVPQPPQTRKEEDPGVLVSFDGKDYLSASRAAEITGYHQDYVGQLAREGTVLARQIGNRWYVEKNGLVAHKAEKDALLAAVQAESVGLHRRNETQPIQLTKTSDFGDSELLTYTNDTEDLLPVLRAPEAQAVREIPITRTIESGPLEEFAATPVVINKEKITVSNFDGMKLPLKSNSARGQNSRVIGRLAVAVATVVVVLTVGYVSIDLGASYVKNNLLSDPKAAMTAGAASIVDGIGDVLESYLTEELVYRR